MLIIALYKDSGTEYERQNFIICDIGGDVAGV